MYLYYEYLHQNSLRSYEMQKKLIEMNLAIIDLLISFYIDKSETSSNCYVQ